jgi:phosphohistidine phosphatase
VKILYLVRHAQATDREAGVPDFDRVLVARGLKQAGRTGANLRLVCGRPDLVVSSPARRALETAHVFASHLEYPVERIELDARLYEATDARDLMAVVAAFPAGAQCAVIVGHNPLLSDLLSAWVPGCHVSLPKAGVAGLHFEGARWAEAGSQAVTLDYFDSPLSRSGRLRLATQVKKALALRIESRLGEVLESEAHMHTRALQKLFRSAARDLADSIVDSAGSRGLLQKQWARRIMESQEDARSV